MVLTVSDRPRKKEPRQTKLMTKTL